MINETKLEVNTLPDETEKQKNCPYCHETDPQSKHAHYGKAMSDKTEYFDFVRKTKLYRRVKARIKSPEDQHPKLCCHTNEPVQRSISRFG